MCAICDPSKQASASTHLVTHSNLTLFAPGVLLLGSFPGEACDPLPFGVYAERCVCVVKLLGLAPKAPCSADHSGPLTRPPLMAFVSGKGETIAAAGSTQEIEQSSVYIPWNDHLLTEMLG